MFLVDHAVSSFGSLFWRQSDVAVDEQKESLFQEPAAFYLDHGLHGMGNSSSPRSNRS